MAKSQFESRVDSKAQQEIQNTEETKVEEYSGKKSDADPTTVATIPVSKPVSKPVPKKLRKGKWTIEEERYASRLIHYFQHGLLGVADGTTLRAFIADKLECDPMRISKKFTGNERIGKQIYKSSEKSIDNYSVQVMAVEKELRILESRFRAREWPETHSRSKEFDILNGCGFATEAPPDDNEVRFSQTEMIGNQSHRSHAPYPSSPPQYFHPLENGNGLREPSLEGIERSVHAAQIRKRKYDMTYNDQHSDNYVVTTGSIGNGPAWRQEDPRTMYDSQILGRLDGLHGQGSRQRYAGASKDHPVSEGVEVNDFMGGGSTVRYREGGHGYISPWVMGHPGNAMVAPNASYVPVSVPMSNSHQASGPMPTLNNAMIPVDAMGYGVRGKYFMQAQNGEMEPNMYFDGSQNPPHTPQTDFRVEGYPAGPDALGRHFARTTEVPRHMRDDNVQMQPTAGPMNNWMQPSLVSLQDVPQQHNLPAWNDTVV